MDFIDIDNAEEATRQWWQQQYGTPLPEEVKGWLKLMSRREVQKARVAEHFLDDATLHKVQDSRRLCQTKLLNVEESLSRVRQQIDRTRRFIRLNAELKVYQSNLYEINKRAASVLTERKELERFETFEAVNGQYQRIRTLEQDISHFRQLAGKATIGIDESQRLYDEAEKAMTLEQQKTAEVEKATMQAALDMAQGERLSGSITALSDASHDLTEIATALRNRLELTKRDQHDTQTALDNAEGQLNALKQERQSMEAHQTMLLHGENIQTLIDEMMRVEGQRNQLKSELQHATTQQNERNEQLARLFTESQALEATAQTLREELAAHRQSIAGQNSYSLQKRAMDLRGRKLMLETGLSLWKSIAEGYYQIEHKNQLTTQMRQKAEQLNRNIDQLRDRVTQLRRQLDEKNYHWTLSKSQNVVEMRGDLQEGIPGTVCGATHHPWHSETISEQNALIATMKADVETLRRELRAKGDELHEMELELNATQGQLRAETENMRALTERQKKDTDQWRTFSTLDRSFVDCSPTTNREARTAMMQQLIEKTALDSEEAQKTLDAFNYHLNAISTLGNEIQQNQQQANDLSVRLNEVNTACQVMARQVEQLNQRISSTTQDFSRRYTELDKIITIPDWLRSWKQNPEALKLRIQGMMDRWNDNQQNIRLKEAEVERLKTELDNLNQAVTRTTADIAAQETLCQKADEQISKWTNLVEKLWGDEEGKTQFNRQQEALLAQQELWMKCMDRTREQMRRLMELKAQLQFCNDNIQDASTRLANEHLGLDLWMGRYNAAHPPVQITELERVLADGKDWNELRQQVRDIAYEQATTQAKVDSIRAEIVELQAEGTKMSTDNGDQEQEHLHQQQDTLEKQRQEILRQIAQYEEQLRAHEAVSAIKN